MSRSGYCDDLDNWELIRYRGVVASAIRGKRGQVFLRALLAALDAMPVKKLIREELRSPAGEVCTLGAIGEARGINLEELDPTDHGQLATVFGIAPQLVAEIEFQNDETPGDPERRWREMRAWVLRKLGEAGSHP